MIFGNARTISRLAAAAFAAGMLAGPLEAAHAQGLIESLFSSLGQVLQGRASLPEPHAPNFVEPLDRNERIVNPPEAHIEAGPTTAFCVRMCDGHFFPVQAHAGVSAAEACHAFCPASQTRLYTGSTIDYAVGRDGNRYADLPTAYAYRKHLVAGCTCNGRDQFGLAQIEPTSDPTLQPGDVVVTQAGLMAFTGRKNGSAEFTPAATYSHFSGSYRDQLATMRITPPNQAAPPQGQASLAPEEARDGHIRSAQR
jgi:hypothetical protein